MLEKIESRLIFPSLRLLSIGVILLLAFFAIAIMLPEHSPEKVTYNDVRHELDSIKEKKDFRLPENTKLGLNEDAKKVVLKWAASLKKEYQQEFISNMQSFVSEARNLNNDVITYEELLKFYELEVKRFNRLDEIKNPPEWKAAIKYVIIICIMMCVVLFCILLVLLKISRSIEHKPS